MTTTQQQFEHLSFSASAATARRTPPEVGARYRLILVTAGVAALIAWGLTDPSEGQRADTDRFGRSATPTDQQLYDGHGKWGGYLPQGRSRSQILQDAGVTERH